MGPAANAPGLGARRATGFRARREARSVRGIPTRAGQRRARRHEPVVLEAGERHPPAWRCSRGGGACNTLLRRSQTMGVPGKWLMRGVDRSPDAHGPLTAGARAAELAQSDEAGASRSQTESRDRVTDARLGTMGPSSSHGAQMSAPRLRDGRFAVGRRPGLRPRVPARHERWRRRVYRFGRAYVRRDGLAGAFRSPVSDTRRRAAAALLPAVVATRTIQSPARRAASGPGAANRVLILDGIRELRAAAAPRPDPGGGRSGYRTDHRCASGRLSTRRTAGPRGSRLLHRRRHVTFQRPALLRRRRSWSWSVPTARRGALRHPQCP